MRKALDTVVNFWRVYAPCTAAEWGDVLMVAGCAALMLSIACGWLR